MRFLICGHNLAGKTSFLASVAEVFFPRHDFPATDQDPAQTSEEFGKTIVSEDLEYIFYSAPSDRNFDFIWEIYAEYCSGYILILDSTQPETFSKAKYILDYLLNFRPLPFVVAANKQDIVGALEPTVIRQALDLDSSVEVIPCAATSRESARKVLAVLLSLVDKPHV